MLRILRRRELDDSLRLSISAGSRPICGRSKECCGKSLLTTTSCVRAIEWASSDAWCLRTRFSKSTQRNLKSRRSARRAQRWLATRRPRARPHERETEASKNRRRRARVRVVLISCVATRARSTRACSPTAAWWRRSRDAQRSRLCSSSARTTPGACSIRERERQRERGRGRERETERGRERARLKMLEEEREGATRLCASCFKRVLWFFETCVYA